MESKLTSQQLEIFKRNIKKMRAKFIRTLRGLVRSSEEKEDFEYQASALLLKLLLKYPSASELEIQKLFTVAAKRLAIDIRISISRKIKRESRGINSPRVFTLGVAHLNDSETFEETAADHILDPSNYSVEEQLVLAKLRIFLGIIVDEPRFAIICDRIRYYDFCSLTQEQIYNSLEDIVRNNVRSAQIREAAFLYLRSHIRHEFFEESKAA